VVVGIRPEAWDVVGDTESALAVTVDVVKELGADAYLYSTASVNGSPLQLVARLEGRRIVHKGSIVRLSADPTRVHLFDTGTGVRLSE